MRNKIVLIVSLFFAFTIAVSAHPLGNFTINNYSRIEVETNRIRLHCVLEMAEISTFQESQQIDGDKNGALSTEELNSYLEKKTAEYLSNLKLSIDGQPVQMQAESKNITLPTGAGNLPTLRAEWNFAAAAAENAKDAAHRVHFENDNYKDHIGWREIVVNRASGINVYDSDAFGSQLSDELKTYPEDMLTAPLNEREANFSFGAAAIPANAGALQNRDGKPTAAVQKDRLAELINIKEITPTIVFFGLLIAFGLGTIHALSPGHGKTVVGAYLVGSKGTFKHAVFLGVTVTITHTLGVFALGLVTFFAAKLFSPDRIMPYLSFISGLIILIMGLALFRGRLLAALGYKKNELDDEHAHDLKNAEAAGFTHTHDGHTHSHLPPKNISWRSLIALGISGGLLPCPSALVLMLAAIGGKQVVYGLLLTLSFSIGLAATLMAVGLTFLYVGKLLDRPSLNGNPVVKFLPVFSAFVIACVGAVICYTSFA